MDKESGATAPMTGPAAGAPKLLPCPFCGSGDVGMPAIGFRVTCENCGCRTDYFEAEAAAKAAWNRRPSSTAVAARQVDSGVSPTAHTPGPWKITYAIIGIEKEMWPNAIIADRRICDFSWMGEYDLTVQQANARLVAAAPDLLEAALAARSALDRLMGDTDLDDDDNYEMRACLKLSTAIARATGAA